MASRFKVRRLFSKNEVREAIKKSAESCRQPRSMMKVAGVRFPSAGSNAWTKKWTKMRIQAASHRPSRADLTCRRSATKIPTITARTNKGGRLVDQERNI